MTTTHPEDRRETDDDEKTIDVERSAGLNEKPETGHGNLSTTGTSSDDDKSNTNVVGEEVNNNDYNNNNKANGAEAGATPNANAAAPGQEPAAAGRTKLEMTLIMLALCSALFLAALDVTIITTAIPTIVGQFDSPTGYTWIGAAYLLANSATVPSWGKISDIWGRKPVLLSAVGIFWIGSLICALSANIGMLIAGRAIQGAGGGGIAVLTNICVSDLVSVRQRGMYYGIFGVVWAIASAIGPVLGGVFTSKVTWRWCFWVNLPISGAGFLILLLVLKLHNPRTPVRQGLAAIDWLGSALIIGATLMFLFGLEFGGVIYPWNSATTICLIVFGVFTFGLFVIAEKKFAKYPVISLALFKSGSNIAAFAVCFAHGTVFISGSYYLPLYFQAVIGASSLLSGVYLLPYALSLSIFSAGTGIWMRKTGKYLPAIIFGMFFLTLGFGLFIMLGAKVNWAKLIIFEIIAGIGVGPNFQSPLIALQSGLQGRDIASATGTFMFIRQLATSISVVVGGVVFQNGMEKQYSYLLAELGPELAGQLTGGSAAANVELVASLQGQQGDIARAAYWNSLRTMWIMYAAFAGAGLLISPLVGQKKLSKEHTEHKTGLHSLRAGKEASESSKETTK
ncbi:major facilitator superfamily domain-containing protein [Biscogniauxia mediterranea]|nr:major facilitator superfamily domain-containing protein [Biscogniauxia mediterranea]